jgi:hypothetical protein
LPLPPPTHFHFLFSFLTFQFLFNHLQIYLLHFSLIYPLFCHFTFSVPLSCLPCPNHLSSLTNSKRNPQLIPFSLLSFFHSKYLSISSPFINFHLFPITLNPLHQ